MDYLRLQMSGFLRNAKSLPIHCIIEQINGVVSFDNVSSHSPLPPTQNTVQLDSYAILPNSTLLQDLVKTALIKLGYSSSDTHNAKGAIQIKNWKPLEFDSICDNKHATIEDILGELTNVTTLRIRLSAPTKQTTTDDVKEKLLQLLLTQSQALLNDSGCPIEKNILASLSKGENISECLAEGLSDEMRGAFDIWYRNQINSSKTVPAPPRSPHLEEVKTPIKKEIKEEVPSSPMIENEPHESSPASFRSYLSHKTRIRTSFDPEYEITRLQNWFKENQHPTRDQMIAYMNELNGLESRKGRRPLDLTNIIYWFKNARAAQRRACKSLDDSYDNEDEASMSASGGIPNENIPYLPNKNAVYIIPFPYRRPAFGSFDNNGTPPGDDDHDEPCDLSINKRTDCQDDNVRPEESHEESVFEKDEAVTNEDSTCNENSQSDKKYANILYSSQTLNGLPKQVPNMNDLTQSENSQVNGCGNRNNNGSISDSENQENCCSPTPAKQDNLSDDDSSDSDSVTSDSDDKNSNLKRDLFDYSSLGYNSGVSTANMSPASIAAMSLAQMSQMPSAGGLHIPQLPPHLAMAAAAYYPMNARYYMQHAANSLQNSQVSPRPPSNSHRDPSSNHGNVNGSSSDSRKRRTRVFIDPLTEIPQLERWFQEDTHPSAYMIDKYCEQLNKTDYRQKFPRLESKNIQLWFKNHRAKVKRQRLS
ncbi:hypothetical protein LOTGIDRAFT_173809 [Lottia gigantea]|uniref:Homeobox domain-containing protein n=1 Tax=Lottia gigantea TaxID=225164 RepID=V4APN7_LOTGI|nr:hypothetical protein LOTGIDRAFT_173809 [Lottia gigantea]ESO99167.1 hypothetical protein LOTGIDRAFT_173809 [Lottia gigantea]